jgi:DNA-binding NarL/FixJ family response regulator
MSIKILLVEDHSLVREGIRMLLNGSPELDIVGEAANGEEAVRKLQRLKADVVLMDLKMPVLNGIESTKQIKKLFPGVRILVLSMHDEESYLIDVLDSGADGYIVKNANADELIFAIKKIHNSGTYFGPEFTLSMLSKYKKIMGAGTGGANISLSERENEVLHLIAQGYTNMEIANKLFTSVRTIETRRKKILEKTGTTNTATMILFSARNNLV